MLLSEQNVAHAISYHFEHISLEQGLSQTVVNSMVRDSLGYLWIGTQEGLNCYDGHSFRVFRKEPHLREWISDNWINSIVFNGRHGLWLATRNGGLNFFDLKQFRFTTYRHQPDDSTTLSCNNINILLCDSQKRLWIGTWGGTLDMLDPRRRAFRHFRLIYAPDSALSITALTQDSTGNIWVGMDGGVFRVDEQRGIILPVLPELRDISASRQLNIFCLSTDENNRIWIGTSVGLFILKPETGRVFPVIIKISGYHKIDSRTITAVYPEKGGPVWLGTPQGEIFRIKQVESTDSNTFLAQGIRLVPRNELGEPIQINWIRTIFADRSGNIWFGTFGQGLIKALRVDMDYQILRKHVNDSTGLSHNFVRTVFEDSRRCLWIGTIGGGLNCYNPQTGRITHYGHSGERDDDLISNYVFQIVEDSTGNLYIATDHGIDYLERTTGRFRHLFRLPEIRQHFTTTIVRALFLDPHGFLWIGSQEGIRLMQVSSGRVARLSGQSALVARLNQMDIWQIFPDRKGNLWIIYQEEGAFYLKPQYDVGKFPQADSVFSLLEKFPQTFGSLSLLFFSVQETRNGTLLFGTNDGLIEYQPQTEQLSLYHRGRGLTNAIINGILEDDSGIVWLSTNSGIFRFQKDHPDPVGNIFHQLTLLEGYLDTEYNAGAYLKDHRGWLHFGSVEGLVSFKPSVSNSSQLVSPIRITGIQVMGKPIAPFTRIPYLKHIRIPYQQNVISFEFQSLDFINPAKNIYSYKLEGFDREWNTCTGRNYVNYTNLNPGDYLFRVRGSNSLGVWNMDGASLRITIVPPFWMTWWFKLMILSLVALLLYMAHKLRLKQVLELERLRIRIASNLHDDVGASLSRIAMYAELIRNGIDRENISRYLSRIATLSREVTTTMSEIVWSIDARNDRFQNLIDRMNDFASGTLADNQIHFKLEVEGIDLQRRIPVDIRQNLYLIFKEALINAVRHSQATEVQVTIRQSNGQFIMTIQDNGKGYNPVRRSGHGLRNMKLRAEAIQASLEFTNGNGFGIILKRSAI